MKLNIPQWAEREQATIRSNWGFFSLCSYVYIGPELDTAYKQATITALRQIISHGKEKGPDSRERERERENFIMLTLLWECIEFSTS